MRTLEGDDQNGDAQVSEGSDLTHTLARQWQEILRQPSELFFEGLTHAAKNRAHGHDRLPQPGFVGPNFRRGGLLIIGQNPGNDRDGQGMSVSDLKQYRLLDALKDAPNSESSILAYNALMHALGSEIMPTWNIFRKVVQPLLDGMQYGRDRIAYLNLIKFRTENSSIGKTLYDRAWPFTEEQIRLLAPGFVVALGVGTFKAFAKRYKGEAEVFRITRHIGDTCLPEAGRQDIQAICAAISTRI